MHPCSCIRVQNHSAGACIQARWVVQLWTTLSPYINAGNHWRRTFKVKLSQFGLAQLQPFGRLILTASSGRHFEIAPSPNWISTAENLIKLQGSNCQHRTMFLVKVRSLLPRTEQKVWQLVLAPRDKRSPKPFCPTGMRESKTIDRVYPQFSRCSKSRIKKWTVIVTVQAAQNPRYSKVGSKILDIRCRWGFFIQSLTSSCLIFMQLIHKYEVLSLRLNEGCRLQWRSRISAIRVTEKGRTKIQLNLVLSWDTYRAFLPSAGGKVRLLRSSVQAWAVNAQLVTFFAF